MSISGVGATPEPLNSAKSQNPQNIDDGKPVSIFDYDEDGTVTVEEQTIALNNKITNLYERFKSTFNKYGFNIDEFKNKFISQFVKREANTDSEVEETNLLVGEVINTAYKELYEVLQDHFDRELEDLKNSSEREIRMLCTSPNLPENFKEIVKNYKDGIKMLVEAQPDYKEWGEEMLKLLNSRFPDE